MTSHRPITRLRVGLAFGGGTAVSPVGEMLKAADGFIYFQFAPEFLSSRLQLSPVRLKEHSTVQKPQGQGADVFDGLYGVFADSLPDGWGLLVMSRALRKAGVDYAAISPLDRLAYVGVHGMGALVYHPSHEDVAEAKVKGLIDLESLARDADKVMSGPEHDVLPILAKLGGTAGGARPKVLVGVGKGSATGQVLSGVDELPSDYDHWIVKFRGKDERPDAGIVEWAYAQTAAKIGLTISATRLFPGGDTSWFGTKRFDRFEGNRRLHLHTLAGLLHADFRMPALDYEGFLRTTSHLTRRHDDLNAAFRLAVFNVVFHNRDDHAKNFSFVMDQSGAWRLSPAYDLTYSPGRGGEHSTAICGEGKTPGSNDLMRLAKKSGIHDAEARRIIDEVESGRPVLLDLLRQYGVKNHPVQTLLKA